MQSKRTGSFFPSSSDSRCSQGIRPSYDGVLSIHCEKESLMHPELLVPGRFETQSVARPAQAEIESIRDMISLARDSGFPGHIHICHISTAQGIALVKKARGEGMSISCAATAHHALLTCDDARDGSRCLRMNPPLRSPADRDAVFAALASGDIDYVESDHAPHTLEDKMIRGHAPSAGGFAKCRCRTGQADGAVLYQSM